MLDKRIVKTRTNIKNAFMKLVEDREMNKISVSDLSAKAGVNRSTFYLHYNDISDVAADIEKYINEIISEFIDEFTIADIYNSVYSLFTGLTGRLDENEPMKRYIFFSTNSESLKSKLKEMFCEKTTASLLNKFPETDPKKVVYPLTFAAAGIVDCYSKWVRGETDTSLEEVIKEISKITEHIIAELTT